MQKRALILVVLAAITAAAAACNDMTGIPAAVARDANHDIVSDSTGRGSGLFGSGN